MHLMMMKAIRIRTRDLGCGRDSRHPFHFSSIWSEGRSMRMAHDILNAYYAIIGQAKCWKSF